MMRRMPARIDPASPRKCKVLARACYDLGWDPRAGYACPAVGRTMPQFCALCQCRRGLMLSKSLQVQDCRGNRRLKRAASRGPVDADAARAQVHFERFRSSKKDHSQVMDCVKHEIDQVPLYPFPGTAMPRLARVYAERDLACFSPALKNSACGRRQPFFGVHGGGGIWLRRLGRGRERMGSADWERKGGE